MEISKYFWGWIWRSLNKHKWSPDTTQSHPTPFVHSSNLYDVTGNYEGYAKVLMRIVRLEISWNITCISLIGAKYISLYVLCVSYIVCFLSRMYRCWGARISFVWNKKQYAVLFVTTLGIGLWSYCRLIICIWCTLLTHAQTVPGFHFIFSLWCNVWRYWHVSSVKSDAVRTVAYPSAQLCQ